MEVVHMGPGPAAPGAQVRPKKNARAPAAATLLSLCQPAPTVSWGAPHGHLSKHFTSMSSQLPRGGHYRLHFTAWPKTMQREQGSKGKQPDTDSCL